MGSPNNPELYDKQMDFLKGVLAGKERVVLFGDFNCTSKEIVERIKGFELASKGMKSWGVPLLGKKDLDHILVRGVGVRGRGRLLGRSDHRLIYADLRI